MQPVSGASFAISAVIGCLAWILWQPIATAAQAPAPPLADAAKIFEEATAMHLEGDLESANRLYNLMLPRVRESGDEALAGRVLNRMSLISTSQGRYFEALQQAREAVQIQRRLGEVRLEAVSLNNAGQALIYMGDYSAARQSFHRALELDQSLGNARGEVLRINNIANADLYQGRYLDALMGYQRALSRLDENSAQSWAAPERRLTLSNLAVLLQKLGQLERALSVYRELMEIPAGSADVQAQQLSNLGALYRHLGDPGKAMQTYRQAQLLFGEQQHLDGQLGVLKNIGIVQALSFGDLEAALQTFEQVERLAQGSSNRREAVQARLYQAEALRQMGRIEQARSFFLQAAGEARRLGIAEELWKALYGLGRTASPEEAGGHLREAVKIIESVRSRLGSAPLRSDFLAGKRQVYDRLIGHLLQGNGSEADLSREVLSEAFQWMESSRARGFQDQMAEALENRRTQIDPLLAGQMREVRSRMRGLYPRLLQASIEERDGWMLELARLEAEYADLESRLDSQDSAGRTSPIASLQEISGRLAEGVLLLNLWTSAERLTILRIGRQEASAKILEWGSESARQVQQCRSSLSEFGSENWLQMCRKVGELLLDGLLADIPSQTNHLIIVPDGLLAWLPFEALPLDTGELLLERFSVSYLPAASFLTSASSPAPSKWLPWAFTLEGFADPVAAAEGDSLPDGQSWPALPESAREVRRIAEVLPGRQRLHLGAQALKAFLFEDASKRPAILHLSTHAAIDTAYPERSRILFSPRDEGQSADFLFLGEVLDIDLEGTELVTLSACDTARGRSVEGEGIQAFSQVFLLAGARSTLASLWKVSDRATAFLMPHFYSRLAEGLSRAEALRQAKLEVFRSGADLSHPAYWAAFVLNGDGARPVPLPWSWMELLAAAVILVVIGALIVRLAQKSKSAFRTADGIRISPKRSRSSWIASIKRR